MTVLPKNKADILCLRLLARIGSQSKRTIPVRNKQLYCDKLFRRVTALSGNGAYKLRLIEYLAECVNA